MTISLMNREPLELADSIVSSKDWTALRQTQFGLSSDNSLHRKYPIAAAKLVEQLFGHDDQFVDDDPN